jgi:hypothetical protein
MPSNADPRDRVREAEVEVVNAAWAMVTADGRTHGAFAEACERHHRALAAYRDALLDAVDEDVARLEKVVDDDGVLSALPSFRNSKVGYNSAITDTRAAIRARKETT